MSEHLARATLAAPANHLRLRSLETAPWAGASKSFLPEDNRKGEKLHQLVERLSVRLGRRQRRGAGGCGGPPARAQAAVAAGAAVATGAARAAPREKRDALYPAWLLPQPLRLEMQGDTPCYGGPLHRLARLYRVEAAGGMRRRPAAARLLHRAQPAGRPGLDLPRAARPGAGEAAALVPAGPVCLNERHQARPACLDEERDLPPVLADGPDLLPGYAELHCLTNFSFQRGASHPQELVRRAYDLGYAALAITDECSVAGVVRAHSGWNDYSRSSRGWSDEQPAPRGATATSSCCSAANSTWATAALVAIARDLQGWGGLCEFITAARTRRPRASTAWAGRPAISRQLRGCEVLFVAARANLGVAIDLEALCARLVRAAGLFGSHLWLAVELLHEHGRRPVAGHAARSGRAHRRAAGGGGRRAHARALAQAAAGRAHRRARWASRWPSAAWRCRRNAERHLRRRSRLAQTLSARAAGRHAGGARRAAASRWTSSRYEYPLETVPDGQTPTQAPARASPAKARRERYPDGIPGKVRSQLEHELELIAELQVRDVLPHGARHRALRPVAETSSARAAARRPTRRCATAWASRRSTPTHAHLLFERFISRGARTSRRTSTSTSSTSGARR